jgi:hypothetical protein
MSEQEQSGVPTTPELTIVDLQNIRSVIDVASRRGAFGAAEMAAVGGVFNKLDAFLASVTPPATPEGEDVASNAV